MESVKEIRGRNSRKGVGLIEKKLILEIEGIEFKKINILSMGHELLMEEKLSQPKHRSNSRFVQANLIQLKFSLNQQDMTMSGKL